MPSMLRTRGGILVFPSSTNTHISWTPAPANTTKGHYNVRTIAPTGTYQFNWFIPQDYSSLIKAELVLIPESGAAGSGKDIDLSVQSGSVETNEAYDANTATDTTSTYDLTGLGDKFYELDFTSLISGFAAANMHGSIQVTQNAVGGTINYLGAEIYYNPL